MNRADFTNLGGFPLEQDTLKFLQDSYTAALSGVAKLCGNKTILSGVEVTGGQVTDGWISYNGELIPFIGGSVGAQVVIAETATSVTFQDGNEHDVYFKKTATCGVIGAFDFSELTPLSFLQNIWLPGDIKEKYCDDAYVTTNFDANGFGLGKEKGWRIMSKAIPDSAGKVFVNHDPDDQNSILGATAGSKTSTITKQNLPNINLTATVKSTGGITNDASGGGYGYGNEKTDKTFTIPLGGSGTPLSIVQPSFIILKLIKL